MPVPAINVVLHNPQIPQNTGNIGRMCAVLNARLHLIHPLGFEITDAKLKRSGMDYWKSLDVVHYENWSAYKSGPNASKRIWLLTTKAEKSLFDADFQAGDALVFGSEDRGAPDWLHGELWDFRIKIPQPNAAMRSLNLSTSAGIAAYEM
ncbi:MAG: tRNA (cytidine(34)-2'-O)-methyltransferase [Opitutales bacterium]|nr:tRNA (cytidine(34)-2'-O)-methyltransferase [Opitutales bacterium]